MSIVEDLFEFICSGPLIEKMGLNPESVANAIDKWLAYGSYLCRLFKVNEMELTIAQKARFYHYYIPVFFWCQDQISQHRSSFKEGEEIPPLVVSVWSSHLFFLLVNLDLIIILCSFKLRNLHVPHEARLYLRPIDYAGYYYQS